MKIRKTIALVVAFAMVAALVPAFGLTAFAATGVVMSDGKTAYAVDSDNLVADGSFESSAWESQLTTGSLDAYMRNYYGVSYATAMNQDSRMNTLGATAFTRVSGGSDGTYAITPAVDTVTSGSTTRITNSNNGPTSIMSFVENTSGDTQKYYVAFSAKAASDEASLSYVLAGVDSDGKSSGSYPSGTQATVTSDGYTVIDAAVDVAAGEYLIINIYDMAAEAVLLDNFIVYEVSESTDSIAFTKAMSNWSTTFTYTDGQTISSDMTLPTSVGSATVSWSSSNPEIIAADGTYTAPAVDTDVTLTATVTYGSFSSDLSYTFKTKSFVTALLAGVTLSFTTLGAEAQQLDLPTTVDGFEGSTVTWTSSDTSIITNAGYYNGSDSVDYVTLTATVVYSGTTNTKTFTITVGVDDIIDPDGLEAHYSFLGFDGATVTDSSINGRDASVLGTVSSASTYATLSGGAISIPAEVFTGCTDNWSISLWVKTTDTQATTTRLFDIGSGQRASFYLNYSASSNYMRLGERGASVSAEGTNSASDGDWHLVTVNWNYDGSSEVYVDDSVAISSDLSLSNYVSTYAASSTFIGLIGRTTWYHFGENASDNPDLYADVDEIRVYSRNLTSDEIATLYANSNPDEQEAPTAADVTVNFLDRATSSAIKDSETITGYIGYTASATSAQKASFTASTGTDYSYDDTSVSSVTVTGSGDVINLYFNEIADTSAGLITNGDFEIILDDTIYGWTVGDGSDMTTSYFNYVEESDGNHYIQSTGHAGADSPYSIRTYTELESGKVYQLTFKIWYQGTGANGEEDGESEESYIGAYLVDSSKTDITTSSDDVMNERRSSTGGIIPQADGTDMYYLKNSDGWTTVSTTLYPTDDYSTLMILGKWLYRQDNGQTSAAWAFDDFVLTEVQSEFTGSVTINYYADGTTTALKSATTVSGISGGLTYYATTSDKEDISYGGDTYFYNTSSTDNVVVENETGNVINLYFTKLEAESVEDVTIDTTVNEGATLPTTATVTYNNGSTATAAVTWNSAVPTLNQGDVVTIGGTVEGLDITATINVFYSDELPEDYADYTWIGDDVMYPLVEGATNLIENGSFETGDSTGFTNRLGTDITGGTVAYNSDMDCNVLTIQTGGKTSTQSIGTIWSGLEVGKSYLFSFYVGGTKPESGNYTYNRVSDSYTFDTNYSNSGNDLITFGEDMTDGEWNYMYVAFTAQTDTIYIQSSWAAGDMMFTKFQLYEIASTEGYAASEKKVKVTVVVDGNTTEEYYVDKGATLSSYASAYPGALISTEGSTDVPNVTINITTGAPEFESSIAIIDGNAVVYAVDEALAGTLIIAQYTVDDDADSALVSVTTQEISVAAGASKSVAITAVDGAQAVRVMLVDSVSALQPLVHSTGALLGSYSPAVLTVSDETQADQGYVGYAMFDGDTVNTRWTSPNYTEDDHCWAIMDFGQAITADTFEIYYNSYASRYAYFKLSVSEDGTNYTPITVNGSETITTDLSEAFSVDLSSCGSFRYIMFEGLGNSSGEWTAVNEIAIK